MAESDEREPDAIPAPGTAIIAGIGQFGIVVSRMLSTNGFDVVVLDHDPAMIERMRKLGITCYYGDATRPDLLHAAGIEEARLFVAALGDREKQTELVAHVRHHHPQCRVIARALDRLHIYDLENAGAHFVERSIFESALAAGRQALVCLGSHPFKAERQARAFRSHDRAMIDELRDRYNEAGVDERYLDLARARVAELGDVMQADRMSASHDPTERGWVPPTGPVR